MSYYQSDQADIRWAMHNGPLIGDDGRPYGYGVLARHLDMTDPANVHYVHRTRTAPGHTHYVYSQEVSQWMRAQARFRKDAAREKRLTTPAGRVLHLLTWPFTRIWHFPIAVIVVWWLLLQMTPGSGAFEFLRPFIVAAVVAVAVAVYAVVSAKRAKARYDARWSNPYELLREAGLLPPR